MTKSYTPPNGPVKWICTNTKTSQQREVTAQTAFFAAAQCGWSLSECICEQVKPC